MSDVLEINDIHALGDYRRAWHRLLAQTPRATFFQSLEWLEAYWRHYGSGRRLRTLVVIDDGQPAGILPLVVFRERTKVGTVRVLSYPLHDWGSFYGPVGPDAERVLIAAFAHLRSSHCDWDTIDLRWVNPQTTADACQRSMQEAGFQAYRTLWNMTAIIDLSDSWEAYLASRPAKWRSSFRRWQRRLHDSGQLSYLRYRPRGEEFQDADLRWDLYDSCEQIAARSWQGSSVTGTTLSHQGVDRFLRDAHAAAVRFGALDLNLLLLDGQPAAFAYNYCYRGAVYGLRIGFDAGCSRSGAGGFLCAYNVRDSFLRHDRFFDLGAGYFRSKRHLATGYLPIYRLSHYRLAAPRTQILRLRRSLQARRLRHEEATVLAAGPSAKDRA